MYTYSTTERCCCYYSNIAQHAQRSVFFMDTSNVQFKDNISATCMYLGGLVDISPSPQQEVHYLCVATLTGHIEWTEPILYSG